MKGEGRGEGEEGEKGKGGRGKRGEKRGRGDERE